MIIVLKGRRKRKWHNHGKHINQFSVSCDLFHKRPRNVLIPEISNELHPYMGGIIKGEGGVLLQAGGMTDHIHIIIRLKPVHSLSEMMQKGTHLLKRHRVAYDERYIWA